MHDREKPLDRSASTTVTWDIPTIVSNAASGKLRVPTFQRSFVWDSKDVIRLFDSIYRGFPIGTLLLWHRPLGAGTSRFGPVEVTVEHEMSGYWVVDGQQRITTLVATLGGYESHRDERFSVYFDFARKKFTGPQRGVRPPRSIPVREVLESRRLLTWLREFGDDLEDDDYDTADALGGALRDYRIPAYIVEEDDERLLREVFDRVNSAGKPIKRAQVFHALFAQDTEPGSPATVVEQLQTLRFGKLDEGKIVQSLLAIRGGDVQRDIHDEFDSHEDPADWYDRTEQALSRAIRFLSQEGAPHVLLLPSTFPLPVLATFFDLHPEPDHWTLQLLSRWLWRGWGHGFGREAGQTPSLRKAIQLVNPAKGHPERAPDAFEAVRRLLDTVADAPLVGFSVDRFMTDKSNPRLVLLALAARRPLDPNGAALDLAAAFENKGSAAIGQLFDLSRSIPANRAFWLPDWPRVTSHEPTEVLDSHLISSPAVAAIRLGDLKQFIRIRHDELMSLTADHVNSRMEPGSLIRPPLSDLIISDAV